MEIISAPLFYKKGCEILRTEYGETARLLEHAMITGRASGNVGPSAMKAFKLAIQLLLAAEQKQKNDNEKEIL